MLLQTELLANIIDQLPEGIVVMDAERRIHYLNEKAFSMTGWKPGEKVPYCTYCQERQTDNEENRCILTSDESIPFFNSHLAVYEGLEEFEMSLKKLIIEDEAFFVLRIRLPIRNENSERARFHELLVHETMLAQEAERKRIARELHDHIGQNVYSLFLGLEVMKHIITDADYENHVSKMVRVMENTLQDIKRLTKSLRPEIGYDIGLDKSLHKAVKDWRELYQIEIFLEMEIENEQKMDPEKELHLFRIIQESVSNAVRHGKATYFSIHLKTYNQYTFFNLHDNGKGFILDGCKTKGLGLKHMYERCKMLDGDIRWISKEGGPTIVEGFVSLTKSEGESEHEPYDNR